uniref:AP complex mu/sigma subunit domain-containing protein n=1 Tax=Ailuropoda melanoleuca TaxID=9646 RepID=A0A7N5JWU8_AILME
QMQKNKVFDKIQHPFMMKTLKVSIEEIHSIWYLKDENISNCLEGLLIGQSDNKLVYKHYTLYFGFCVDSSENELGILDLVQVFVETLDKCFEYASELDLIFHVDKVCRIFLKTYLRENGDGGMVMETNTDETVTQTDGAPARAVSPVKNMNLPEIPRNTNMVTSNSSCIFQRNNSKIYMKPQNTLNSQNNLKSKETFKILIKETEDTFEQYYLIHEHGIAILFKVIKRSNTIPIRIPVAFFREIILKFI